MGEYAGHRISFDAQRFSPPTGVSPVLTRAPEFNTTDSSEAMKPTYDVEDWYRKQRNGVARYWARYRGLKAALAIGAFIRALFPVVPPPEQ